MKKVISIILLFVLLTSMTSCGKPGNEFVFQKPTDELVVYYMHTLHSHSNINNAVKMFEQEYPDVNLVVEEIDITKMILDGETILNELEPFKKRLLTELLAGTGPDVLLWDNSFPFDDLEKAMEIDIFEDLEPYFAADATFDSDEFISGVFDAGLFSGERLFVPLNYLVPYRVTTIEAMNHYDVNYKKDMDFAYYANELQKVYAQIEGDDSRWLGLDYDNLYWYLKNDAGLRYIDYEKSEASIDPAELKMFLDAYGPFIKLFKERIGRGISLPAIYFGAEPEALNAGKAMEMKVSPLFAGTDYFPMYFRLFLESGQTPVFCGIPHVGGGKTVAYINTAAAIVKSSKNKANAYAFLKLLLSEEITEGDSSYLSIRKGSTERRLQESADKQLKENQQPELWKQYSEDFLSTVTDVEIVLQSWTVRGMVEEAMMPYVLGEKSYDECFADLEKKLQFYISE